MEPFNINLENSLDIYQNFKLSDNYLKSWHGITTISRNIIFLLYLITKRIFFQKWIAFFELNQFNHLIIF